MIALPHLLIEPLAQAARALAARPPRQDLLSGIHNPFGRAAAFTDPWRFLDLCESASVVDVVAALIGPDVVLWDSELYLDARQWQAAARTEGRHWPADPLAGAVVDVALASGEAAVSDVRAAAAPAPAAPGPRYVVRYLPATSLFNRDPRYAPNRLAMEERPLVNYLNRPLWLVRGEDRAGSDFAVGFQAQVAAWAAQPLFPSMEV